MERELSKEEIEELGRNCLREEWVYSREQDVLVSIRGLSNECACKAQDLYKR